MVTKHKIWPIFTDFFFTDKVYEMHVKPIKREKMLSMLLSVTSFWTDNSQ